MHLRLITLVTLVCASGSSYESDSSESRILNANHSSAEAEDAISSGLDEDESDWESVYTDPSEDESRTGDQSEDESQTDLWEQVDDILDGSGDFNAIITLLEESRDQNLVRSIASYVLYKAALSGDRAIVKKLVSLGANIGPNIDLPLGMMEYLIDIGATDLELRNSVGSTTLISCGAMKSCPVSFVRLLIEKGADVKAVNNFHDTALHTACRRAASPDRSQWNKDDIEFIELLIEAGSDLDAKDRRGASSLAIAIERYAMRPGLTEVLLRGGADACDPDGYIDGPLEWLLLSHEDLRLRLDRQCRTIAAATKVAKMFSESGLVNSVEVLNDLPGDVRSHAIILAGVKLLKSQMADSKHTNTIANLPSELTALIDPSDTRSSAIVGLAPYLAVFGRSDGYVYNAILELTENLTQYQLVDLATVVSKSFEYAHHGCQVCESTVSRFVRKSIHKSWACDPAAVLKNLKRELDVHLFLKNRFREEEPFLINKIEEYLFGKDGLVGGLEAILESFTHFCDPWNRLPPRKRRLLTPLPEEDRNVQSRQEPEQGA